MPCDSHNSERRTSPASPVSSATSAAGLDSIASPFVHSALRLRGVRQASWLPQLGLGLCHDSWYPFERRDAQRSVQSNRRNGAALRLKARRCPTTSSNIALAERQ